ncbi:hydroxypyruvate isomerase family protein [Parablautia intestinalis]|uniref:hydroxypyruvate isomerase family protein n=1 Tax=Parablautia intestinalis TaxID=2320100 RepID=UPI0023C5EA15|nr:TIM barrel protein [Parablautia intestinalis]MDE7047080.1 TIM barrel protein [Lachnospiraceae bacterium]
MKLSVCVDAVYMGKPIEEAVRKVKEAGLDTIEFWTWEDKDVELLEKLHNEGIRIAAFCTGFISLVEEGEREKYIESLKKTIETAKRLGCRVLISQTGQELPISREKQHKSMVEGLKACVPYLEESGITLVVEPLNTRVDHAGYYLSSSDEAAEIMKEVGSPYVKMLFDIYHQQIMEGDLIRRIKEYIPYIGHFHAAGNPGRHELYQSEVDYGKVFAAIQETGYEGCVGLEYFPLDDPEKGLAFAKKLTD